MQLTIHATPGAKRCAVGGSHDGALRVAVNLPAEKGRANEAIAKLIAQSLGVKPAQVELLRGQTSRRKVFVIHDAPDELQQRIDELMRQP
jgi:uncharacterized protein (TIGR00251 family)